MICGRKTSIAVSQLLMVLFATCALTTGERERQILDYYTEANRQKYADLLVDPQRYTTAGTDFHKKYYGHLIGIAGDIVEKKKLAVEKGSIGFYFDKRSGDRNRLYLGLDIDTKTSSDQSFEVAAATLIGRDLKEIIQTFNSCRSVFNEKEIIGMVIGWIWSSSGGVEHLSLWIVKEDFTKFEEGKITFDELVQRSSITNTTGRVIRLQLYR